MSLRFIAMLNLLHLATLSALLLVCVSTVKDVSQVHIEDKFSLPDSLNPSLINLVANDSIQLNYNGTGAVPGDNESSPQPQAVSPLASTKLIEDAIFRELIATIDDDTTSTRCSKCIAVHQMLHLTAISQPVDTVTNLLIRLCAKFAAAPGISPYIDDCEQDYGDPGGLGPWYAMMFSSMSMATGDMHLFCASDSPESAPCEHPEDINIDESRYFSPKPKHATIPPKPSGEVLNVLHLSDFHLDPRYDVASEANCSTYMCCRPYSTNLDDGTTRSNPSIPASRFGSYKCDSPPDLALSAFKSMPSFFNVSDLAFSIFTGDIVSHDTDARLSRKYVTYEEETTFKIFDTFLPKPVYATLGNHDTLPRGFNTPNSLNPSADNASNVLSWNYDLLSSLWHQNHWLDRHTAQQAATHYGAYSTLHPSLSNLRIISINSDFYYRANPFNIINATNPDSSGILAWLATELSHAEHAHERAWLIAHVPAGHSKDALHHPTSLFYSIIQRFSPATIAAVFFGHTHQDQLALFYAYSPASLHGTRRNTTQIDTQTPLTPAFIGPSITPLTGLNAGYRLYQIDSATYSVMDFQTYIADISNSLSWTLPHGPVWELEYSARETYAPFVKTAAGEIWPDNAPLNATFWHFLTETMGQESEEGRKLWELYTKFEVKSSNYEGGRGWGGERSRREGVCEIRSASGALVQRCKGLRNEKMRKTEGDAEGKENGASVLPWLWR